MRLIDVDKIEINEECTFSRKGIKAFLNAIPIAFDVDKVFKKLEDKISALKNLDTSEEIVDVAIKELQWAIDAIKAEKKE